MTPRDALVRAARVIRQVAGMPDYQAHLAHLRDHHPGTEVPSEREYFEAWLRQRYDGGPTRCC